MTVESVAKEFVEQMNVDSPNSIAGRQTHPEHRPMTV
jgi:hypothetical protein